MKIGMGHKKSICWEEKQNIVNLLNDEKTTLEIVKMLKWNQSRNRNGKYWKDKKF